MNKTIGNHDEIIATGDLFKQAKKQINNWNLRKFLLSGIFLTYFGDNGSVKGRIDISGCIVRKVSPEECKNSACKYAFGLFTKEHGARRCLVCATNEEDRTAWINVIEAQIEEFDDIIRRFINSNEIQLGSGTVMKKNLIGMEYAYRLVITNYPRMILVDPMTITLKEQIFFRPDNPPSMNLIDEQLFYVRFKGREFKFRDLQGSRYWVDVFRQLPRMPIFVPKIKAPINIGEVLVAASPSESSLRRAKRRADTQRRVAAVSGRPAPNGGGGGQMNHYNGGGGGDGRQSMAQQMRLPSVAGMNFPGIRRGPGGNEGAVSTAVVTAELLELEAQVIGAEPGQGDGEDEDYGDYEEEDEGEYDEEEEEEDEEEQQQLNESIGYLKTALSNIKDVVTRVSKEIETMSAPKAKKQEIVRALMVNVSALSSNLQGLYSRGMNSEEGVDADLVGMITDVVDETAGMLQELTSITVFASSGSERPASNSSTTSTGSASTIASSNRDSAPIATKEEFIAAVNQGLESMSNRVACQMAYY